MHPTGDVLRGYFDAAAESMLIVDAETGRVVDANAKALADTGYQRGELLAMPLARVIRRSSSSTDAARNPAGTVAAATLLTRSGGSIAVEIRTTSVRQEGTVYLIVVIEKPETAGAALPGAHQRRRPARTRGHAAIIGRSEKMLRVCALVESVAGSDATVLIHGESGTGKEVVASAIHARSRRQRGPFVRVNCAALPPTLLESELFGHVKGAFTGATRDRCGRFKQADGGTILLDEIGSMPLEGQATLLRVLQEHEFEPVGSSRTVPIDVRVIAATNVDLEKAVSAGTFRADLFYRLNVFGIRLPPLRERAEDIPLLAEHFLRHYREVQRKAIHSFAPATLSALCAHTWPGNVRELENAVEHATIVETGSAIVPSSLPPGIAEHGLIPQREDPQCTLGLRERLMLAEREILLDTLRRANGIRKRAAEMLGIDSRNMPYFLRKHRLQDSLNGF